MDKKTYLSRRMHTPDDPARAAQRAALREVSRSLIPLHRALINAARDEYLSFGMGEIAGPGQLLQLVQEDPFFAWLKPMTSLIVDIDEMARVDFSEADVAGIARRVDAMFGSEPDAAFSARYVPLLQQDVDVAVGHAAVRQARANLKQGGDS